MVVVGAGEFLDDFEPEALAGFLSSEIETGQSDAETLGAVGGGCEVEALGDGRLAEAASGEIRAQTAAGIKEATVVIATGDPTICPERAEADKLPGLEGSEKAIYGRGQIGEGGILVSLTVAVDVVGGLVDPSGYQLGCFLGEGLESKFHGAVQRLGPFDEL